MIDEILEALRARGVDVGYTDDVQVDGIADLHVRLGLGFEPNLAVLRADHLVLSWPEETPAGIIADQIALLATLRYQPSPKALAGLRALRAMCTPRPRHYDPDHL